MGLRGLHARPLSCLRPEPKPQRSHRFRCRECQRTFVCLRDDRRFCSGACRQRNYRRRGEQRPEKLKRLSRTRGE